MNKNCLIYRSTHTWCGIMHLERFEGLAYINEVTCIECLKNYIEKGEIFYIDYISVAKKRLAELNG